MLDDNLIATLEQSLRQTRNAQKRLELRLREAENEVHLLREEIDALEKSARQTESAIDSLLATMRSSTRTKTIRLEEDYSTPPPSHRPAENTYELPPRRSDAGYRSTISFPTQPRYATSHLNAPPEPINSRFADRTITQACTLLLREAGKPLHVNELYRLLVEGGMEFKGNNPTISIAVSLNRNRRFRKVDPGTFDLMMREASHQAAS